MAIHRIKQVSVMIIQAASRLVNCFFSIALAIAAWPCRPSLTRLTQGWTDANARVKITAGDELLCNQADIRYQ